LQAVLVVGFIYLFNHPFLYKDEQCNCYVNIALAADYFWVVSSCWLVQVAAVREGEVVLSGVIFYLYPLGVISVGVRLQHLILEQVF